MMWKTNRYAHASALPAIAAALALSSTPAWSQEDQPAAEPESISIALPPPTAVNPAIEPITAVDPVIDPIAETAPETPADYVAKPKSKPTGVKASRTITSANATAPRSRSAAPAPAAVPSESLETKAPTPQPIGGPRPAATDQAIAVSDAPEPVLDIDEDAIMLGGGALALLALGGGAITFARRRRDEDEESRDEAAAISPATFEPERVPRHDPIYDEQPAILAPSAFAWGKATQPDPTILSDRDAGGTWVERAYRGPTPDNPSLSLRKRLKRANFFDARESRVKAGKAEPVAPDAGLPEHVSAHRELELA